MYFNLLSKTTTIRFRIFTEDGLNRVIVFFQQLQTNASAAFQGSVVERLYEIRVDNDFYSGPSYAEFRQLYERRHEADHIRLILHVTSAQQQPNQAQPQIADVSVILILDRNANEQSRFDVVGMQQNATWLNGAFAGFGDLLATLPRRNVFLHSKTYEMLVQVLAVFILVTFSVYAANKLASLVKFEYREVYLFVVIFLLLSNLWTYVSQGLIYLRNKYYPVVDVRRNPRKPILLAIISFIGVTTAGKAVEYILSLLIH